MLGCASVGNDSDERDQSRERNAFDREGADKSVQVAQGLLQVRLIRRLALDAHLCSRVLAHERTEHAASVSNGHRASPAARAPARKGW
jgi:hypothetical protein